MRRETMKRIIILILTLVFTISCFASCKNGGDSESVNDSQSASDSASDSESKPTEIIKDVTDKDVHLVDESKRLHRVSVKDTAEFSFRAEKPIIAFWREVLRAV